MAIIEAWQAILLGIGIGGLGGFTNSVIGWLSGTEAFDTRKNVKSIITAIMAGVGVAYASSAAFSEAQSMEALIGLFVVTFLSAAGVQQLAHNTSKVITKPDTSPSTDANGKPLPE